MAAKRLTLAEQIAQLEQTAPVDYDPEDIGLALPDATEDAAAGREHYLDVGPSSIRKLHESVSDPKYDGVRVSRSQLAEDDEGPSDQEPDGEEENEGPENDHDLPAESSDMEPMDESLPSPTYQSDRSSTPTKRPSPPPTDDLSTTLKKTREAERTKGKAVSCQLSIYDNLLDARIRLQKCVSAANRLPHPDNIPTYLLSSKARTAVDKMLVEAMHLSEELFDFREKLMFSNEALELPPRKRRKMDVETTERDWEKEVQEESAHAAALESTFHPHLLSILQKWSSKVLAVAPSALLPSNRTKFSRPTTQLKSATQLVEETLLDRQKLHQRTRIWRGQGTRIGVLPNATAADDGSKKDDGVEGDAEVFDDTDFYQQLLRDVIDSRSAGGIADDNAEWRAAQRQKKAKKSVDTKASKGRKLRYELHEKIQNFMVPIPVHHGWHEEQIDELFASLLGRGFNNTAQDATMDGDGVDHIAEADDLTERVDEALKLGFRVFG